MATSATAQPITPVAIPAKVRTVIVWGAALLVVFVALALYNSGKFSTPGGIVVPGSREAA